MPKETFLNLPTHKKEGINRILINTFYNQPISQVRVSQIVQEMAMSRGAFYKYFSDLEDAYSYIIHKYARLTHQDMLIYIDKNEQQFFQGIRAFLIYCSELPKDSDYWKGLVLMTKADYQHTFKRSTTPAQSDMLKKWCSLLDINQFNISSKDEAISFLYFATELVTNSLANLVVNQWSTEELLQDYDYKINWLENGLIKSFEDGATQ